QPVPALFAQTIFQFVTQSLDGLWPRLVPIEPPFGTILYNFWHQVRIAFSIESRMGVFIVHFAERSQPFFSCRQADKIVVWKHNPLAVAPALWWFRSQECAAEPIREKFQPFIRPTSVTANKRVTVAQDNNVTILVSLY